MSDSQLQREVARRRTFAIISHPDAGKTTLTEKLLLYGGAIHLAGSVKARRASRHATSDWMTIEKERGISVTSSVLQFHYKDHAVNLLDTPGHQDFSEDTYRTLAAADAAVMLIDAAKGVEPQTKKLFAVCRMRGIPIFTFVNKLDRYGRAPLDLMDELEKVLGIRAWPMNWPIGMGPEFRGVYSRRDRLVHLFSAEGRHGESEVAERSVSIDDPEIGSYLTEKERAVLAEEIELLDIGGDEFTEEKCAAGQLTPMFFGSAMTNFGVGPFLDAFLELAPPPAPRTTIDGEERQPTEPKFAGFIFKIQANMDPAHRDRIAFLRVVSGRYTKGMSAHNSRLGKEVRLAKPTQFMASERTGIEDAWPGDVIGLFDPGQYRIGDTLSEGGEVEFQGVPRFSPEHFAIVRSKDPLRRKQMEKGLEQLAEEGTIQIFQQLHMGMKDPIVGVVGALQFEVLQYRVQDEYGARIILDRLGFQLARWVVGPHDPKSFDWEGNRQTVTDRDGLPLVLFRDEWALQHAEEKHPDLKFVSEAPQLRGMAKAG